MIAVSVLLLLPPVAPQGDGALRQLLVAEKVVDRLPTRKAGTRPAGLERELYLAGPDAADLAWTRAVGSVKTPPGAPALLGRVLDLAGLPANPAPKPPRVRTLKDIESFFVRVHRDVRKALGQEVNFSRTIPELHGLLDRMLDEQRVGWSADDRKVIQREWKAAGKVDRRALHAIAQRVLAMATAIAEQRQALARQAPRRNRNGVTGTVLLDRDVGFGRIVVGGPDRNVYNCDQIAVVVDLGGDDEYRGAVGGTHSQRRLGICIDVDGADVYRGGSGALGSATYGLGVCIDLAGADDYTARSRSAGFGAAGLGLFFDMAGADKLVVEGHSGGVGVFGCGVCIDLTGDDVQRGTSGCFGVGISGGVGLFADVHGGDQHHVVGTGGKTVLALGAGCGLGDAWPGGVGVFLDHAGDDTYTGGDLALGAGDRGGVGICVDLAGDDSYIAGGLALGAGRRGGVGVMVEVAGKDHYFASEGLGVTGADGTGCFTDRAGDDIFEVRGAGMGRAGPAGMAFFQDLGGKNRFRFQSTKLELLAAEPGGFALFRSLGVGDSYAPADRDPGPKGRRLLGEAASELHLRR